MMKRAWKIGVVGACMLVGCLDATTSGSRCDGELVAAGTACVMRGSISETGFDCPPTMPYEYGGEFGDEAWVLCSSDPDLDAAEVDDAMREGGRPDQPSDPSDPSQPSDPSKPSDPSQPNDPADPTDPTDPTTPVGAICGDAVVAAEAPYLEVCDDGNTMPGDGCSADCKSVEVCGNGIVDPGEQCDDANTADGDVCSATCELACIDSDFDGIPCESDGGDPGDPGDPVDPNEPVDPASCGDGVLDPGEVCDDGNSFAGDGCSPDCTSLEACGNGIVDPGEECDDGNTEDGDGCDATCRACRDDNGDGICDP